MAEVCYVDAKGQVVCVDEDAFLLDVAGDDTSWVAGYLAAKAGVSKEQVPREYLELALKALVVIAQNFRNVPGNELNYRRDEILGSIRQLLRKGDPPSLLAYHFNTQPGDVFGAYNLNKAELVYMHGALEKFKSPKPKPSSGSESA